MRLEVACQGRLGLVREILDLLVLRTINLRGIEVAATGRVYLNFMQLEFDVFRSLMAEIRRIDGVTDVRTVAFMPTERDSHAIQGILAAMPEAVLSIDLKGRVALSNPAAALLFNLSEEKLAGQSVSSLVGSFDFNRWLGNALPPSAAERVVVAGQDFLLDITPIQLPGDDGNLATVSGVVMLKSALRMDRQLKDHSVHDDSAFSHLLASSERMRQVINHARKLAMLDAPLLIMGETGTGKDVLAHASHLRSARGCKPFLALNCAALPDEVAESELFGHAGGAYPNALESKRGFFEQANGGSVLLDEIAEMSPHMQNKLLRFLNDGIFRRVGEDKEMHVDVRVICATQKNLLELVRDGHFREDLYYRLNVLTLTISPLRVRPEDIMPLASMFVARFCDEQGVMRPRLAPNLAATLRLYPWPGNVRQLKNALYHAMAQREGATLCAEDIDLPNLRQALPLKENLLDGSLVDINKRFERSVLTRLYGAYPSTRKLAKRLGVSHTAIANKLREYGLSRKKTNEDLPI